MEGDGRQRRMEREQEVTMKASSCSRLRNRGYVGIIPQSVYPSILLTSVHGGKRQRENKACCYTPSFESGLLILMLPR